MTKEQLLEALEADFANYRKVERKLLKTIGIIFSVLFILVSVLVYFVYPENASKSIPFLGGMFVFFIGLGSIAKRIEHNKSIKSGRVIYDSIAKDPNKIVWFYEKIVTQNNYRTYCIVLHDDEKNSYETSPVEAKGELTKFLNQLANGCRNAVQGFHPEWSRLYYKDPRNFRTSVIQYEQQFKK